MSSSRKTLRGPAWGLVLGFFTATLACEPPEDAPCDCEPLTAAQPLVEVDAWRQVTDPAEDPLPEHRPALLVCPDAGWGEELGVLEVRTAECNYLSAEQPLEVAIAEGDTLRLTMWWQNLVAEEQSLGHVAVHVDGELLWEIEVPIPGPSAAHEFEFVSPLRAEAGATVNFHLHNHGQNTWTLAELSLVGRGCCE